MAMTDVQEKMYSALCWLRASTGSSIECSWAGVLTDLQKLLPHRTIDELQQHREVIFSTSDLSNILIGPGAIVRGGYHVYKLERTRGSSGERLKSKRSHRLFTISHVRSGRTALSYARVGVPADYNDNVFVRRDTTDMYMANEIFQAVDFACQNFDDYDFDETQCMVQYRLLTPNGTPRWQRWAAYSVPRNQLFNESDRDVPIIAKLDANILRVVSRQQASDIDVLHTSITSSNCIQCGGGIDGFACNVCGAEYAARYDWRYPFPMQLCRLVAAHGTPTMTQDPLIAVKKAYRDWLESYAPPTPSLTAVDRQRQIIIS